MTGKKTNRKAASRFVGTFTLPSGQSSFGELKLKGDDTLLHLQSAEFIERIKDGAHINGTTHGGDYITCIDCISPGTGSGRNADGTSRYSADVFPHYVTVGKEHLAPDVAVIDGIHFTTSDLPSLFHDFDAFGLVVDSRPIIDSVLEDIRKHRPVEVGDHPQVFYFTGKDNIVTVETCLGKVSVNHRPTYSMGGPHGVSIKNRMVVSVEPDAPMKFEDAVDRMYTMARFLSITGGRKQGIKHVHVTMGEPSDEGWRMLNVHPSYTWKQETQDARFKPHPGDVPLDPIRRRGEFEAVLKDWLLRDSTWRLPRTRYLDCMENENRYDADRMVAAANMFDILPTDAVPASGDLPTNLAATRDACVAQLKMHPAGVDRDGALSALGRMGKPSLLKKVLHRTAIVVNGFGPKYADLALVASVAVKCRNYFVHGSSGDFDYRKVDHLAPFLTDALEFIFAASDFIEAGWGAARWTAELHGWGHSFARFRSEFAGGVAELKQVLAEGLG